MLLLELGELEKINLFPSTYNFSNIGSIYNL